MGKPAHRAVVLCSLFFSFLLLALSSFSLFLCFPLSLADPAAPTAPVALSCNPAQRSENPSPIRARTQGALPTFTRAQLNRGAASGDHKVALPPSFFFPVLVSSAPPIRLDGNLSPAHTHLS